MVKYRRGYTPLCLVDAKVQKAYDEDINKKEYLDSNSRYKCSYQENREMFHPVRTALKDIYKNKCAYCETQLNRTFINIEHYRPKKSNYYENGQRLYYVLAYSWTNLLPICDHCNTKKSNKFEIDGVRVSHEKKTLQKMQYITKVYNRIEKPKFIHPEIDDYENMFRFNTSGKMVVYRSILNSHRMTYTIDNSDLNENALMERRAKVLEDFIKIRNRLINLFQSAKKHKDNNELKYFKEQTKNEIKDFFNDKNEFIAVRKFIIHRLRFYLLSCDDRFVKFFNAYLEKYIKTVEVYNEN